MTRSGGHKAQHQPAAELEALEHDGDERYRHCRTLL
jgi:hypothetical protein